MYILLEDINLRKNLIHELKQERVRHSSMNKQSRDRIRELAVRNIDNYSPIKWDSLFHGTDWIRLTLNVIIR